MANDPVLQRSMFQKQAPTAPSVAPSVGLGIGSVTTPDQNAQAMRSLFQPTVSMSMPMPMQEPVQSFQEGGLATPLVAQYNFRNRQYQNPPSYAERTDPVQFEADRPAREAAAAAEKEAESARYAAEADRYRMLNAQRRQAIDDADALARYPAPKSQFRRDVESVLPSLPTEERVRKNAEDFARIREARQNALQEQQTALEDYRKGSPGSAVGDYFRSLTPEELKARAEERAAAEKKLEAEGARIGSTFTRSMDAVAAPRRGIASVDMSSGMGGGEAYSADPSRSIMSQIERKEAPAPAPAREREKGPLSVILSDIKAERAAERRENALLALMQAGFAMAAGRSPNALSNIGAGGQAGIGAFAAMERASREDAAARRREAIQLDLANRQLEKDPEAVRTYAILGGYKPGDPKESYSAAVAKGFNATQSKEGPKLAAAIINNPMSSQFYSQQELKDLADYARRGIIGMGAAGKEAFPGFSGTLATPPAK
jgi:hypothetical protein